ncbi:hypothetical protein ACFPPA_01815 [Rhodanobacter ginsengisoli]|uniref:DUF4149 domain-containing protein n=1 Tax=Rhodanobacter ginsengisoli TaxID=418646 RepID=A0ABW0QIP4_9GAMM
MSVPPAMPVARSSFINVLGWIFICLAGFTTLIGLLQNLMLQLVFLPTMQQPLATQPLPPDMPAPTGWMLAHMVWFFRGFLLLSIITLTAAIGLLRRREWARRLFIGLMAFAIAYQLFGLVFQWWFMGSMQRVMALPANAPAQFASGMHGFMLAMQVFGAIMAIGFSVLFGWIIKRLRSAPIRREFHPARTPSTVSGAPE